MGHTKAILSGDILEIYTYERSLPQRRTKRKKADRGGYPFASKKRRPDSINRLRANFLRLVRANLTRKQSPAFASFTMLQIVPYKRAVIHFTRFTQRLRARCGGDIAIIAVPEWQKRGAIHFHALIWGLPVDYVDNAPANDQTEITETDLKESVNRNLQHLWGWGYVDCISTDGSNKLAGYMAKYMLKGMHDERLRGKRAYHTSRNVLRPVSSSLGTMALFLEHQEVIHNPPLQVREYNAQFLGRAHYKKIRIDYAKYDRDAGNSS